MLGFFRNVFDRRKPERTLPAERMVELSTMLRREFDQSVPISHGR